VWPRGKTTTGLKKAFLGRQNAALKGPLFHGSLLIRDAQDVVMTEESLPSLNKL
jgi:hypothetical protein